MSDALAGQVPISTPMMSEQLFEFHKQGKLKILAVASERRLSSMPDIPTSDETGDATGTVMDHARAKLARKGCDLLVVNDVGGGKVFGAADNEAVVLGADGETTQVPRGSKSALAQVIWDRVTSLLGER